MTVLFTSLHWQERGWGPVWVRGFPDRRPRWDWSGRLCRSAQVEIRAEAELREALRLVDQNLRGLLPAGLEGEAEHGQEEEAGADVERQFHRQQYPQTEVEKEEAE